MPKPGLRNRAGQRPVRAPDVRAVPTLAPEVRPARWQGAGVYVLLALVTVAAYGRVIHCDFINFDDPGYVQDNRQVQAGLTGKSLVWAFTTTAMANWHPLTWLSLMLDSHLFGVNPRAYHLTNLLFHLANTLLVLAVLRKMTGALWPSAMVAALFGLHPLHVESVVWIAERKDVLSTFFALWAMWTYMYWCRRRGAGRYGLVMVFFLLSLLSKPMWVTLPFLLLLLDYWPLRRITFLAGEAGHHRGTNTPDATPDASVWQRLREKLPLFSLAGLFCGVAYWSQHAGGALVSWERMPLGGRVANAILSYTKYVEKTFWPSHLSIYYPMPDSSETLAVTGAGFLLLAGTALVLWQYRRPWLVIGWFWYLGTLVPVIGLVQIGAQSMADRYTYVPLIGLFVVFVWGVENLTRHMACRKVPLATAALLVLSILFLGTWRQVGYWRGNISLYEHSLAAEPRSSMLHNLLGMALAENERYEEAAEHYRRALSLEPDFYLAAANLGNVLVLQKKYPEAVRLFQYTLEYDQRNWEALNGLGCALGALGRRKEAVDYCRQAAALATGRSGEANVRANYATALCKDDQWTEAVEQFYRVLRVNPNHVSSLKMLAWLLAVSEAPVRNPVEAMRLAQQAAQLAKGQDAAVLASLAAAYAADGQFPQAVATVEQALALAQKTGQTELVQNLLSDLESYRHGQALVESVTPSGESPGP